MDIFITIVLWILGLYAGSILMLAIVFSSTAHTQTTNNELNIVSIVSSVLLVLLIWMGISSITGEGDDLSKEKQVTEMKTAPLSEVNILQVKSNYTQLDYTLWSFYVLFFISFIWWMFGTSKNEGRGKDLVMKKFMATMSLKKDESGLKPWNPNWKPEDEIK